MDIKNKTYISMVNYDEEGKLLGVALGNYNQIDVDIFTREGYVDVDENVAREADAELERIINERLF